jgi:polysaccharide export outer membrane protein
MAAVASAAAPSAAQAPAAGASPRPPLELRAGDVLRVSIWREGELSGDFLVDENGVATLPLLGQRPVAGIPLPELRTRLTTAYREHLRNPAITITPLRRVQVIGEVNTPGLHLIDPTVSLSGAVAVAGGPTSTGDLRHITLVRQGSTTSERVLASASLADVDIHSGDQILVGRRSWIDRNSGLLASAFLGTALTIVTQIILK